VADIILPLYAEVVVGLEGWMLRLKLGEIQPWPSQLCLLT